MGHFWLWMQRIGTWVGLLVGLGAMRAVCGAEPPADTCILLLQVPASATVTVDGRDYARERRLVFDGLEPGQVYKSAVRISFSNGQVEDREVSIAGGRMVTLSVAGPAANRPELLLQKRHREWLDSWALAPDGRLLLTGAGDHTAALWDVESGRKLRMFTGMQASVKWVAISPDGRLAAACEFLWKAPLCVWEIQTGKRLLALNHPQGDGEGVAFSADSRQLLVGQREQVLTYDVASGQLVSENPLPRESNNATLFSDDMRWSLLASREDQSFRLWSLTAGRVVQTFRGHTRDVKTFAVSSDGKRLATGTQAVGPWKKDQKPSKRPEVFLWDVASGDGLWRLEGHADDINHVAFSGDGRWIATAAEDRTAMIFDAQTGQRRQTFNDRMWMRRVAFDPTGANKLITGGPEDVVWWNAESGMKLKTLRLHGSSVGWIKSLRISRDGRYIASAGPGGSGNSTVIWDATAGKPLTALGAANDSLSFAADGRGIWSIAWGDGTHYPVLWDIFDGRKLKALDGYAEPLARICASHDGRYVVCGARDRTTILWDVATGKKIRTFPDTVGDSAREGLDISPDGRLLLTTPPVTIWELATGRKIAALPAEGQMSQFSPDSRYVLTRGTNDDALALWDASSGALIRSIGAKRGMYGSCAAFHPSGRWAVTAAEDHSVLLWDLESGALRQTFRGHTQRVVSAAFTPNGRLLLTGSDDATVCVWDPATGEQLLQFMSLSDNEFEQQPGAHEHDNEWIVVSPEGLFDGSVGARDKVTFRVGATLGVVPVDRFFQDFFRPGLLAETLSGSRPMPEVELGRSLPPAIRVLSPQQSGPTESNQLTVDVEVTDKGGGIRGPWLTQNGAKLLAAREAQRAGSVLRRSFPVTLIEGENRIAIHAASADGSWESEPALLALRYERALPKPELYLLAVGIGNYADAAWKLKYAEADAREITRLFRERGGALYQQVHATAIFDAQATKAGILQAVATTARASRPQDTVLLCVSAQGAVVDQQYYLLPGDFHRSVGRVEDDVRKQGLLAAEVGEALAAAPALKRVLAFDTGQSGPPAVQTAKSRNPFAFRGSIERLSRAQGAFAIAVTAVSEQARELPELSHGVLTYSLLAGLAAVDKGPLQGEAIRPSEGDQVAHILQWFGFASTHVPRLTRQFFGEAQDVQHSSAGASFPVLPVLARPAAAVAARSEPKLVRPNDEPLDEPRSAAPKPPVVAPQSAPAQPAGVRPALYLVAVGVNQYAEPGLNLRFARSDAQAMAAVFRGRAPEQYGRVEIKEILDEQATKEGVLRALEDLAGRITPRDTLVVFVAGHGVMVGQRYYFIPHEFRRKAATFQEDIQRQGLPADQLGDALGKLAALKRVMILDTCASGGVLGLSRKGRDPLAFQGAIQRVGQQRGVFILAASGAGEEAQEIKELGHGVLTYSLLAGIHAVTGGPLKATGIAPQDSGGAVDVLEWFSYAVDQVPRLTKQYLEQEQDVHTSGQGSTFLLLPARGGMPAAAASATASLKRADACVLELDLPGDAKVTLAGRNYGPRHRFNFDNLEPGTTQAVDVEVAFAGGGKARQRVLLEGGRNLRVAITAPHGERPDFVLPTSLFGPTYALVYSADGKYVLSASAANLVLWELASGAAVRQIMPGMIEGAVLSKDGKQIITGGGPPNTGPGEIVTWDIATGRKLRTVPVSDGGITDLAISPDGRKLLVALTNHKALLLDVRSGEKLGELWAHSNRLTHVAFSPDGRHALTTAQESQAVIWELAPIRAAQTLLGHEISINCGSFSADGRLAITGDISGKVIVWDVASGKLQRELKPGGSVSATAFTPDGKWAVAIVLDAQRRTGNLISWDLTTGAEGRRWPVGTAHRTAVGFSPDGRQLLTATGGNFTSEVLIRDWVSGQPLQTLGGGLSPIVALAFSADGRRLTLGSVDNLCATWDLAAGKPSGHFAIESDFFFATTLSCDGRRIMGSKSLYEKRTHWATIWDTQTGKELQRFSGAHQQTVMALALNRDAKLAATGASMGEEAVLWDAESGNKLRTMRSGMQGIQALAFSRDGTRVAATAGLSYGKQAGALIIWEVASGKELKRFPLGGGHARVLRISPDGTQLLVGRMDSHGLQGTLTLLDAQSGEKLREFESKNLFLCGEFSADGRKLLISAGDLAEPTVELWDLRQGTRLATLPDAITATFAPDARTIATAALSGKVRLWDQASLQELVQLSLIDQGAQWLALTPDGAFDGSPGGLARLHIRVGEGLEVTSVDGLRKQFHRPGLLGKLWVQRTAPPAPR